MSDRHKEALAHLTYGLGGSGLGENGGFALLTGEVGTGKTTISRCLMEQLPENTQVAFILNPTLSSKELLATLCDELKIRYRKTDASLKTLTDKISEKLLKNHKENINTLLIIDEAQHLQPEVLEQLRLLTNLETNTKKLLQVILIGQPELQQLLQRRDLRQLAQRITARYHLMPLNKQELSQYISHRLLIADCPRALFTPSAISKVHQLSGGIPRIINLLCHSALMIAYNQNDSLVNKKIVLKAAENTLGLDPQHHKKQPSNTLLKVTAALSIVTVVSVTALGAFLWGQKASEPQLAIDAMKLTGLTANSDKTESQEVLTEGDLALITSEKPNLEKTNLEKINSNIDSFKKNSIEKSELEALDLKQAKSGVINSDVTSLANTQRDDVQAESESTEKFSNTELLSNKKELVSNEVEGNESLKKAREKVEQSSSQSALKVTKLDDVSDDLLTLFQSAVAETARESGNKNVDNFTDNLTDKLPTIATNTKTLAIKPLTDMPNWVQQGIPSLTFEQHIYSSDGHGWITVNGRDRYEGDMITSDLQVNKILPQQVILKYRGETFSLPALTNW